VTVKMWLAMKDTKMYSNITMLTGVEPGNYDNDAIEILHGYPFQMNAHSSVTSARRDLNGGRLSDKPMFIEDSINTLFRKRINITFIAFITTTNEWILC
jgi:hypothetical protein